MMMIKMTMEIMKMILVKKQISNNIDNKTHNTINGNAADDNIDKDCNDHGKKNKDNNADGDNNYNNTINNNKRNKRN